MPPDSNAGYLTAAYAVAGIAYLVYAIMLFRQAGKAKR
jgi:hypothetical protein